MFCEGQVEGLLEAERGAVGVGPVELLLAEVCAYLVQVGLANSRAATSGGYVRSSARVRRGSLPRASSMTIPRVSPSTTRSMTRTTLGWSIDARMERYRTKRLTTSVSATSSALSILTATGAPDSRTVPW